MNGEIDLVSNTLLTNQFMMSSSCRSALQNTTLQITQPETVLFNSNGSRKSDMPDFNFSSNIISGLENTCSESLDINRTDADVNRYKTNNLGNVPNNSNLLKTFMNSSDLNDAHTSQPVNTGLCNLDETNKTPYCLDNLENKITSSSELIDFSKISLVQTEGLNQLADSEFKTNLLKTHTKHFILDNDGVSGNEVISDYRYSNDSITSIDSNKLLKSESKSFSLINSDNSNMSYEFSGSNNLWNHSTSLFATSSDHSTNFVGDPISSFASSMIPDENVLNDAQSNGLSLTSGSGNSKRAITGAHQVSRLSATGKSNLWANTSSNNVSNSTLGYLNCSTWTSSANNICGVKPAPDMGGDSSCVAISSINSSSECSHLSWPHTNHTATISKPNCQVNSNTIGTLSYSSGASTNTYPTRSPISSNNLQSSNLCISTQNNNKAVNETNMSNIYNMFPKRPQHRMMAHWQQQHQHHSTAQQMSLNKNFMTTSNNLQLNTPTVSSLVANNRNDNFTGTFNGGCSVLQSLNNGMPLSTINSLAIGSSGDSFATGVSSNDNSSLDNFKYGLDQQIIDVMKSFEMTSIGGQTNSIITSNANNTLIDDMSLSLNEMDPQLSQLNNVSQLSAFGSSSMGTQGTAPISSANNSGLNCNSILGPVGMNNPYAVFANVLTREEGYSRKVFVGGLPPDIDEEEITTAFRRFGSLIVDWPHKTESKAYFPPKGYCFLLFQDERSVQSLINACIPDENKYYWCVSSPTMKDKPVQIRPWNLADSDFVMDGSQPLDPRKTIFVGGVPRPLRAIELALIMDRLYGGVCYAGIDTDPELKYPKGAGRVAFSNQQSYIAAISARFVQLQHNEIDKRVEVKPYVLDNQMCDECQGTRCGGKFAPFFCANVTCLQYYCEQCWVQIHSRYGREYHKPLVKEGAERPRPALYRW